MSKFVRTVVLVVILIEFITLQSCHAQVPWSQISDVPFETVRYDSKISALWAVGLEEKSVYRLATLNNKSDFKNAEKISSPNDTRITDMCTSNGVWISSFPYSFSSPPTVSSSSKPNTISRYIEDTKSWQTIGAFPQATYCKSLKDNGVVFWSRNEIMRFSSTDTQPQHISTEWNISYVTDDVEGNLLVSTVNREIYKQTQHSWVLVDTLPPYLYSTMFVDKSGILWVTSGNTSIYKYTDIDSTPFREEMSISPLGWRQDFFQDKNGMIWLVTNERLMTLTEGQFQGVNLPPHTVVLQFGSFDVETNTLYVSTEDGVFSLDLDEYPALP